MLVLSRRESEKILFPNLGITVEVSRIQGNTVRLGIDAPDEIRIIRGELEPTADLQVRPKRTEPATAVSGTYSTRSNSFEPSLLEADSIRPSLLDIQKCLDTANLAVHLAQNQLQQQLTDRAEEALDQALLCLKELESVVVAANEAPSIEPTVREASTGYRVRSKKIALLFDDEFDGGLDDDNSKSYSSNKTVAEKLKTLGYKPVSVSSSEGLIQFLRKNEQPSLVLTSQPVGSSNADSKHSSLRMFGVGSLQKSQRTFQVAHSTLTCWFTDVADESAFANSL